MCYTGRCEHESKGSFTGPPGDCMQQSPVKCPNYMWEERIEKIEELKPKKKETKMLFWKRKEALENELLDMKLVIKEVEFEKTKMQERLAMERDKHDAAFRIKEEHFIVDKKIWKDKLAAEQDNWKNTQDVEASNLKGQLALAFEQKIADMKAQHDQELTDHKAKCDTALVNAKTRLAEESYEKMAYALQKLHSEGNTTTKFMQEMTMTMLNKHPSLTHNENITETVNVNRKSE